MDCSDRNRHVLSRFHLYGVHIQIEESYKTCNLSTSLGHAKSTEGIQPVQCSGIDLLAMLTCQYSIMSGKVAWFRSLFSREEKHS